MTIPYNTFVTGLAAATLTGAEAVAVIQGGTSKQTTTEAIAALAVPGTMGVPSTIPDLRHWFQADIAAISNGKHLPQLTNSAPKLISYAPGAALFGGIGTATTLNGLPLLSFTGGVGQNYIFGTTAPTANASMALGSAVTIFVVFNATSHTNIQGFCGNATAGGFEFDITTTGALSVVNSGTAVLANSTTTVAAGTWFQGNATYDGTTGNIAFRIAQAAAGTAAGTTHPLTGTNILCGETTTTGQLNGLLAEMIIYERVLTGTEIGNVEAYLHTKWGV
jgi:Concanavalin A-like lectin/glucanases superfamily